MQQKHIRIPDDLAKALDKERSYENDFPSESELIRRLLWVAINFRLNYRSPEREK